MGLIRFLAYAAIGAGGMYAAMDYQMDKKDTRIAVLEQQLEQATSLKSDIMGALIGKNEDPAGFDKAVEEVGRELGLQVEKPAPYVKR